jgi:transcriptional regulator with XRE-family HTH domain
MKFSEKIKNIRLLQKMTQEEFSCFLGIGYASILFNLGFINPFVKFTSKVVV